MKRIWANRREPVCVSCGPRVPYDMSEKSSKVICGSHKKTRKGIPGHLLPLQKDLAQGRCQYRESFNRVAGSCPVESTPLARDSVCQSKKVLGGGLGKNRGLGSEPCVWIRFKTEV